ncbi:MAG: ADP-ribosylglycohydrolase family protein [Longimicrobiales bacterium]
MIQVKDRIAGGLVGLLVGDALGVPYEFHPATALPPVESIDMQPPGGFVRSYPEVPPGTWSDDGAQALCLLASLLHCGQLDLDDFGRRLCNWRYLGYMAVDGKVFDVGSTTQEAIQRLEGGVPAHLAGSRGVAGNGNGSLMRALPMALWHKGSDEELVRDAMLQSVVTHAHARSQLCCALYCLWARGLLEQRPSPWDAAIGFLSAHINDRPGLASELNDNILPAGNVPQRGSGYVVDCLWSARSVFEKGGYESAVLAAIALGNDTDTTACVTGGICGVAHGVDSIPPRWRAALREPETTQTLLGKLLKWRET